MNPLLAELLRRAQEPMVGPTATEQELSTPKVDQSVGMAQLRGFGSGALEGARSLTSPLSLASLLPVGRVAKGAVTGAKALANVTPELVQAGRAVKQVVPMADDVTKLAAQLKQRMMQIPSSAKVAGNAAGPKPLGATAGGAEFAPVGGESAVNAARTAMARVPKPVSAEEQLYRRMMGGGRHAMAGEGAAMPVPQSAGRMGSFQFKGPHIGTVADRGRMLSETGEVDPRLILGGGAALGGGLMIKKIYDTLKGVGDQIQEVNPIHEASDILDTAAGRRGRY